MNFNDKNKLNSNFNEPFNSLIREAEEHNKKSNFQPMYIPQSDYAQRSASSKGFEYFLFLFF
ncbi:MAG: hypothetical protein MJ252_28995 [archaeon]|nr:hypothetical protein [archaeon]